MKYLQKTANKVISYRTILILLIIAFSCLLFPMLLIAKYDIPAADDYSFGTPVHDVIKNGGSFSQLIEAAVSRVQEAYYSTQGTISAVFLFSIQPAVFGDQYYVIVPYIMLSMLCIGIYSFLTNFFSVFVKHKLYSFLTVVIVMIICSQFLPSPVEGFYWYNGAIYYTFFFGLSLLLFSLLIRFAKADNNKIPLLFIIILLCIIIAFSNLKSPT